MRTQRPNQQHAPRGKEPEQKKMRVRDVMTENVISVAPSESVREAAIKLSLLDVGSLPVCDRGKLVGMITDRDIALRVVGEGEQSTLAVSDAMTETVIWAYEDDDIQTLVKCMEQREIRRVPVLDHEEKLVGIVALADLAWSDAPPMLKTKSLRGVS